MEGDAATTARRELGAIVASTLQPDHGGMLMGYVVVADFAVPNVVDGDTGRRMQILSGDASGSWIPGWQRNGMLEYAQACGDADRYDEAAGE